MKTKFDKINALRNSFRSTVAKQIFPDDLVTIKAGQIAEVLCQNNVKASPWFTGNLAQIDQLLHKHGAILFRGFDLKNTADFSEFKDVVFKEVMDYTDASSPRTEINDQVYTSTDYPKEEVIQMHCELSYSHNWPEKLAFFCELPADSGGETTLADTRKVFARIPEDVKDKFRKHGILYYRYLTKEAGLPWYEVFGKNDKEYVESYCLQNNIQFEWLLNDTLKMQWHRPAVRTHPITGEEVWFNHGMFFNHRALPETVKANIQIDQLPFNTFYGDGTEISLETFDLIKSAFDQEKFGIKWQAGDLVLVDNLLMSHGRNSFSGDRKILVAMGDPMSDLSFE